VLRQRSLPTPLGLHQPIWVDDPEFDLDSHVRRVVCPAPGGMTEFCTLVEQLYAQPLDHNRPLWQTWVVEGLEGGHVALVMLLQVTARPTRSTSITRSPRCRSIERESKNDLPRSRT
jgi:diacylglycerol O-acyltransferase / wax synthase